MQTARLLQEKYRVRLVTISSFDVWADEFTPRIIHFDRLIIRTSTSKGEGLYSGLVVVSAPHYRCDTCPKRGLLLLLSTNVSSNFRRPSLPPLSWRGGR